MRIEVVDLWWNCRPMPDPAPTPPPSPAATPAETAAEGAAPETLTDEERAALAEEASRQEDA